ncbi:MAG: branched-chain amino acid ABC transporter permease [Aigarchaeota archaeon]|nr:branched-chain amino acid ABC transporter permease [Candidatus Pelearchaeum maunauluense]
MVLDATTITRIIFWGLVAGSIYTLLATGLNIIFGVMKVVNFAHGEVMILGSYVTFYLWSMAQLNPYMVIPVAMLVVAGLGMLIERLSFRPIKGTSKINEIFLSLALILILQNAMAVVAVANLRELKPVLISSPFRLESIPLGPVSLPNDFAVILSVTALVLVGLLLVLRRTGFGRRLRAVSQNRTAAALMGVDVERMDMISFGIGSALAALAGAFLAILAPFDPYSGTFPAIKAFAVIILGGLGSISGAVVAGFILGLSESAAAFLLGGVWKDAIAFAFLTAILVVRPEGIFGERG